MLFAWIGSALSPEPRLDRFLRSVSSGTRPRNALLIAAVTATAQAVESHADTAVTGSELPRTLLRDAIQGTDCVDILVIGDSNTAIHGFGWIDGLMRGSVELGGTYFASPIYPMISVANDLGYGVAHRGGDLLLADPSGGADVPPLVVLPTCSDAGGCLERGTLSGPTALTLNCNPDSDPALPVGFLAPVACQLEYGWVGKAPYTNYGAGIEIQPPGFCHETDGLPPTQSLTYRVSFGAGGGGSFTMRVFNAETGASYASRRVVASADGDWRWASADLGLPADASRHMQTLRCSWGGAQVGPSDAVLGPIALGWHSVFRSDAKGVSATPLAYRGGASLGDLREDIEQVSDETLRQYFTMLRSRQHSVGGSGRVILFIQGGVNLDSANVALLPDLWAENVSAIVTRMRDLWIASGFAADQFGAIAMVSHPFAEDDPNLGAIRIAARSLAEAHTVESLTVVDVASVAPWSDLVQNNWHLNTAVDEGPDDFFHLKPEGFAGVGTRIVASLIGSERCAGDIDRDSAVGPADIAFVLIRWGTSDCAADVNRDGLVDGMDLSAVLIGWGGCH